MLAAIHHANAVELAAIVRLWLTEGIPAAFAGCPMEYEHIRDFIAADLQVPARAVNLVGSGRIGFSLSPKKFPRLLLADSDLDVFIVDKALFEGCMDAAERWRDDVQAGRVFPGNEWQRRNWPRTFERLSERRRFGFCDPKHFHPNYEPIRRIRLAMTRTQAALERLGQVRDVSARVYANWDRVIRKISLDLRKLCSAPPLPALSAGPVSTVSTSTAP